MDDQNRILAGLILSCKPEDLKGVAQKADGSLAVVAPNGMKFVFTPVELDNARDSFCLPAVTSTGSVTENPLAEPVEANGHGAPASTGSADGLSSADGAGSAAGSITRRRRKEKHL